MMKCFSISFCYPFQVLVPSEAETAVNPSPYAPPPHSQPPLPPQAPSGAQAPPQPLSPPAPRGQQPPPARGPPPPLPRYSNPHALSMNLNKEAMTSVAEIYDFVIKIQSLRFRGPPPPHPPPPGGPLRQPPPPGVRRPLPPRPRPRPRPRPARPASGGSILGSVSKSVANLGGKIKCAAEDLYADQQLADKQYIRQQLDCVLSRGPCDENGNLIRSECARQREGTYGSGH